jgi:hypothetical protein
MNINFRHTQVNVPVPEVQLQWCSLSHSSPVIQKSSAPAGANCGATSSARTVARLGALAVDRGRGGLSMSDSAATRQDAKRLLPESPRCDDCDIALSEPYGWCANCRAAYCLPCGRLHFCTPSCLANGCMAGLCVRRVEDGALSETWGLQNEGDGVMG